MHVAWGKAADLLLYIYMVTLPFLLRSFFLEKSIPIAAAN